jgi:hypothetical protein
MRLRERCWAAQMRSCWTGGAAGPVGPYAQARIRTHQSYLHRHNLHEVHQLDLSRHNFLQILGSINKKKWGVRAILEQ